jgi:DNA-binding NarL/FixJ family response regulator
MPRRRPDRADVTTVAVIAEQALIRDVAKRALRAPGFELVSESETARAGVESVVDRRPDIVVMEITFEDGFGVEMVKEIAARAPQSRILILTASRERDRVLEAIIAGASGYILKHEGVAAITRAVRALAAGESVISPAVAGELLVRIRERATPASGANGDAADAIRAVLTARELDIFKRLASGESNHQIARAFSLSENTVKNHVASILTKLRLENRVQAAVEAVRNGFSCIAGTILLGVLSDGWDPGALLGFLSGG